MICKSSMYVYTYIHIHTCREYFLSLNWSRKCKICCRIANNEAAHTAVLSPAIQNTPCTMNVPNILSQYTMNVRLELLQKFKIKNMLTCCVRPNHNIIVTKCIIKYFRYDPQKIFLNMVTSHWCDILKQKRVRMFIAISTFRNSSLL
jgi:hypothetical protein